MAAIVIITTASVAIPVAGVTIAIVGHAGRCSKHFEVDTGSFTVGAGRLVALAHKLRVIYYPRS